jgi:hypothetical protein
MGISIWWQHRCYLFIYSSLLLSFTFHSKFSLPFTFTLQRERERDWGIHLHYYVAILFCFARLQTNNTRILYMASSTFALYTTQYHRTLLYFLIPYGSLNNSY